MIAFAKLRIFPAVANRHSTTAATGKSVGCRLTVIRQKKFCLTRPSRAGLAARLAARLSDSRALAKQNSETGCTNGFWRSRGKALFPSGGRQSPVASTDHPFPTHAGGLRHPARENMRFGKCRNPLPHPPNPSGGREPPEDSERRRVRIPGRLAPTDRKIPGANSPDSFDSRKRERISYCTHVRTRSARNRSTPTRSTTGSRSNSTAARRSWATR